ncbi:MAG: hypothetical protein MSQ05_05765 [Akkermansia sp.]|nr:hypothetical protein [Akkermansia sp.]
MREIARRLNVSHSTGSREIKRGMVTHIDSERREFRTYSADFASERHAENMTAKGPNLKIGCDHALVAKFKELIIDRKYSTPPHVNASFKMALTCESVREHSITTFTSMGFRSCRSRWYRVLTNLAGKVSANAWYTKNFAG